MNGGWYYMAGCYAHLFNAGASRSACGNHDRTNGLRWHRGAGGPLDRCAPCQRIAEERKAPRIAAVHGISPAVTMRTRWVPELLQVMAAMHARAPGVSATSDALARQLAQATNRRDLRERFQLLVTSCARSGLLEVVHKGKGRHTAHYRLPLRGHQPGQLIVDDLSEVHEATPDERVCVAALYGRKEGQ